MAGVGEGRPEAHEKRVVDGVLFGGRRQPRLPPDSLGARTGFFVRTPPLADEFLPSCAFGHSGSSLIVPPRGLR